MKQGPKLSFFTTDHRIPAIKHKRCQTNGRGGGEPPTLPLPLPMPLSADVMTFKEPVLFLRSENMVALKFRVKKCMKNGKEQRLFSNDCEQKSQQLN